MALCKVLQPLSTSNLTTIEKSATIKDYMDPVVWNFLGSLTMTDGELQTARTLGDEPDWPNISLGTVALMTNRFGSEI